MNYKFASVEKIRAVKLVFFKDIFKAPKKRRNRKEPHLSENGSLLPNCYATWNHWKTLTEKK